MGNQLCNCVKDSNLPDQRDQMHTVKGISKNTVKNTNIREKGFKIDDALTADTNSSKPFHEANLSTDDDGRINQDLSTNKTSYEQFTDSQSPSKNAKRKKQRRTPMNNTAIKSIKETDNEDSSEGKTPGGGNSLGATKKSLVTTQDSDCKVRGESGNQQRNLGAGFTKASNHQQDSDSQNGESPGKRGQISLVDLPENLLSQSQDVNLKSNLESSQKDPNLKQNIMAASQSPRSKMKSGHSNGTQTFGNPSIVSEEDRISASYTMSFADPGPFAFQASQPTFLQQQHTSQHQSIKVAAFGSQEASKEENNVSGGEETVYYSLNHQSSSQVMLESTLMDRVNQSNILHRESFRTEMEQQMEIYDSHEPQCDDPNRTTSDWNESQYENSLYGSGGTRVSGPLFNNQLAQSAKGRDPAKSFQNSRSHFSRSVATDQSNYSNRMSTNTMSDNPTPTRSKRFGMSYQKKGKMLDIVDEYQESEYFDFDQDDELEQILGQQPKRLSKSLTKKQSEPMTAESCSNFKSIRWHEQGSNMRDDPRTSVLSAQSSKSHANVNRLSNIAHLGPANRGNNRLSSIAHLVPVNKSNNRLSSIAHLTPTKEGSKVNVLKSPVQEPDGSQVKKLEEHNMQMIEDHNMKIR